MQNANKFVSLFHQVKQLNFYKMENLSKTIEERAINLIIKGMDVIEAVKKAIEEENKLIDELISQRTERSKRAKEIMKKNTFAIINLK